MEAVKESLVIDSNSPIPIYHQLRNILKNELKIMTPNQQFYTENNLTKKYSISRHTAIRAVNELVKDGHLYRHRGKGTFVRGQQNNRKFNKIVLFLPEQFYFDSIIEYFGIVRMIQGITDEVNKKNELLLLTIPKDVDETEFCIERISNPSLDGIILLPYKNLKSIIAIAQKNLKPYILLNAKEYSCGTNSVISDECLGMTEAIEYLVSFGHKKIAFVGRQSENVFGRFCGYKQALKQNDIFFDEQRVISWSAKTMQQDMDILLSVRPDTTAIIAGNDYIASNVIEYLKQKNIAVPEDISVIGFDNTAQSNDNSSVLTTIDKFHYEMGQEAARLINHMINENLFEAQNLILPTKLVKGGSTTIAKKVNNEIIMQKT